MSERNIFVNDTATTEINTLSLHDALPIFAVLLAEHPDATDALVKGQADVGRAGQDNLDVAHTAAHPGGDELVERSEEHTSELQSRQYLVCRLLLEKNKTLVYPCTFYFY